MIKIYSSLTLGAFIFTNFFSVNIARASEETDTQAKKLFIVTAYYSPLPDQKVYLRGSYEADIKLNGAGIAGASGKQVFPGMLAAPKTYSFGTKVFLEGFGVGEVADRGGAIITLENGETKVDRIDIWMGKGEEGLKRALFWGKRNIYGYAVANASEINIDLSKFPSPDYAVKNLTKFQKEETGILSENVWLNSDAAKIKELQIVLKEMGLFSGNIDGIYSNELKIAVTKYQLQEKLIDSSTDIRAGYTGAKTRISLKKNYIAYKKSNENKIQLAKAEADKKSKELAKIEAEKKKFDKLLASKVETHITNIGIPKNGEIGQNVRVLQQTMKALGYFDDKDTAIFGEKTKRAVINYQIDKGLIGNENSKNAGVIDKQTLTQIKEDLKIKLKTKLIKDNHLVSINI